MSAMNKQIAALFNALHFSPRYPARKIGVPLTLAVSGSEGHRRLSRESTRRDSITQVLRCGEDEELPPTIRYRTSYKQGAGSLWLI